MWMWNALAAGATGVMFWQWRPELLGPESPGYGLTTADGSSTDRVEAVSAFAAVASLPQLEGRRVTQPAVGLVVSRLTALHAFATDRSMDLYRDAVLGAYRAFTDADVPIQFVHEGQLERAGVPDNVRSLYWPMPSVASERTMAAIESFVTRGGRLIAEAGPAEYTPTGHRRPTVPPAALARIFGATELETTSVDARERSSTDWGELDFQWQREIIETTTAQVRGAFSDGTPAVVEHRIGEGSSVLIAGYPSIAYARGGMRATSATLASLLGARAHRDSGWVDPRAGLVTRSADAADGAILTFALNWTSEVAHFRVADDASVLSGPAADGGVVPVPGMSALLVVTTAAPS
jgi:beta-galactosidase